MFVSIIETKETFATELWGTPVVCWWWKENTTRLSICKYMYNHSIITQSQHIGLSHMSLYCLLGSRGKHLSVSLRGKRHPFSTRSGIVSWFWTTSGVPGMPGGSRLKPQRRLGTSNSSYRHAYLWVWLKVQKFLSNAKYLYFIVYKMQKMIIYYYFRFFFLFQLTWKNLKKPMVPLREP